MKRFYSLIIGCLIAVSLFAQTENNPLSISQAIANQGNGSNGVWVKGYIVGEMHNYSNSKFFYSVAPPFQGTSTFLLADAPYEHDFNRCLVVQFPASALVDQFNLEENPEYWQKEIALCGNLQNYMSSPGLKSITGHRVISGEPHEDETLYWNFFEDAEDGTYSAASSSSMFAGGTYSGTDGEWAIVGGTYGNNSNDNKWGSASFRLRYTEGATGEKGSLTMTSDKHNGMGYVRFWAGNYKDDSSLSAALSIFYSTDGGRQWIPVAEQVAVKRGSSNTNNGMSEYAFPVNVDGSVRLKIEKVDNTSAGINIDNIHISDYRTPTSAGDINGNNQWFYSYKGGICFMKKNKPYVVQIYQITGALLQQIEVNGSDQRIALPQGMYIIKSNLGSDKVVVN